MAEWFENLDAEDQQVVLHGWGSAQFSSWTASFLLSIGTMALTRNLSEEERGRFRVMMAHRRSIPHQPGHKPDRVEQLYQHLHNYVAKAVGAIDDETGHHGERAVQWLDRQATYIQQQLNKLL